MKPSVSAYLDILRILAALTVFMAHFSYDRFGNIFMVFRPYAHQAVIVFFVLSGYVIAYVVNEQEAFHFFCC